jgi:methionine-rich copper-binding protein CopC
VAAAKSLVHDAGLDDADHNVQVLDVLGPDSLFLIQAPPAAAQPDVQAELLPLPGFRFVEPYEPLGATDAAAGARAAPGAPAPVPGTWTALAHAAPSGTGTMMLLPDGRVLAQGGGTAKTWYALTPDATGSYVNGTWSQLTSMGLERLYFGSNVLPDGRVFVVGGEYSGPFGSQNWINSGEIYNPVTNTWTGTANFPQSQFGDDPTVVLPDGRVLAGYLSGPQTYFYNPATNTWSAAGTKLRGDRSDEETWLKLPDDSILSYDVFASISTGVGHAQRYVPATNTWVDAGTVPVQLSSSAVGEELGPAFLLPDGRAFFLGANGHTAYYTPSTNAWAAGPDIPGGLGADDAPGAIIPNGHILFAADHPLFSGPTSVFEFDPATNTFTNVTPPSSVLGLGAASYNDRMLMLPNGQVMLNNSSNRPAVYTPVGSASAAWQPTVSAVTDNGDGTYTLTGTQLNGISEGASYGDDAEMSSNYPLVRLVDAAGHVAYARTFNWSSTGVATGSTPETVHFAPPAGFNRAGATLSVVANGIASDSHSFGFAVVSSTPANGAIVTGTTPTTFVLHFSDPYDPASAHANALSVNGIAATSVTQTDATTLTFQFATSPVTAEGVQSMDVAAGAFIKQGTGEALQAYHAGFRYATVQLQVTATDPDNGAAATLPFTTLTVQFNRAYAPASLGTGNLTLSQGTVTAAAAVDATTARYTIAGIVDEGPLTYTLAAGALTDTNGTPMLAYAGNVNVQIGTAALPAAVPVTPLGSLAYQTGYNHRSAIDFSGDTDNFTINVNAGQQITVLAHPTGTTLRPTVQLLDPGNAPIGSATAPAAGKDAVLQTVAAGAAGTYTVTVGAAAGTLGAYTVQVDLNAAPQAEAHGGPSDDTRATAQDLGGAFLPLGGGADRAAVLGTLKDQNDYYSFHLDAGQSVTLGAVAPVSADPRLFGSPSSYGTDQYPYAVAVGDVNGDGIPDLVTANYFGTVSVLPGNGDGTFGAAVNYNTGVTGSYAVALADLRHTGKADLIVADPGFSGRVAVLLNRGDGTFAAPTYFTTGHSAYAVAVDDVDGDGKPDIVTASSDGTVSVLRGNGDGTFRAAVSYSAGSTHYFHSLALADFRGTGKPDIVVANSFGSSASVLLNRGDGTFGAATSYTTGSSPYAVAVADVNGDGKPDIVTGNYSGTASVLLGNGDGTFAPRRDVNTGLTFGTYSVAVGDVNGDGKADIVAERYDGLASVVQGNGDGTFGTPTTYSTGAFTAYGVALADLRGIGLPDLVSAYASFPGSVKVLLNQSSRFDVQLQDASGTVLADGRAGAANVDHSAGFADHSDLTANGSTSFSGTAARLTGGGFNQAGSLFSSNRVRVDQFNTSFTFQANPGTNPPADGLTFTIQGNGPTALGPIGGGLGYGPDQPNTGARGIRNSVAVKFDLFNNAGEGTDSTGLFSDGRSPTVPEAGSGDVLVDLTGTGIDLNSRHPFRVDLAYDGTTLTERITDAVTNASYATSYAVDIPALVGGATAYVGFTAGTGSLTAVQDILSWTYQVSNLTSSVNNFVAPGAGTYYARVTGVGPSRDYRLVLTRGADFDTEPNAKSLIVPAQYLVPSPSGVATALGYLGGANPVDTYEVSAVPGQILQIGTATPGAGAGEFRNALDPMVSLYGPTGNLLASDDNSAPDGRNALVSYAVPAEGGGLYFLEVRPSPLTPAPTAGEYVLTAQGTNTPTNAPFTVAATTPADKSYLGAAPATMTVTFNHNVLMTSLAASELQVDGLAATGFTVVDGTTVTFTLPALPSQLVHTVSIAGGLIQDVSGTPLTDYDSQFKVSTTPPTVIASSVQGGDSLQSADGSLTETMQFSEPLNPATVTPAAFALHGNGANRDYTPSGFSYIIDTSTLTLTYTGLRDDFYQLRANNSPQDYFGLHLVPYAVNFGLDVTAPAAYPTPLRPVLPRGSLVYQGDPYFSTIIQAGEQDTFTLNVDAGQTVTVLAHPLSGTLRPTVTVTDPSNNSAGATAPAAGQEAVLQTAAAATTGSYTITVGGAGSTVGSYTVQVILNAALDTEQHRGPANATRAMAQNLNPAFLALPEGASRAAVLGRTDTVAASTTTVFSADFESGLQGFTINNGPIPGHVAGLWHLSTGRGNQAGHSPTHSLYYGRNEGPNGGGDYNVGNNAGYVTSSPIALPTGGRLVLDFNYLLLTEGNGSFDVASVQVSTNGGATFTTVSSSQSSAQLPLSGAWRAAPTIDLTAYAGQTILLRFSFDTIDSVDNNHEGWYVDDVKIQQQMPTPDYYAFSLSAGDTVTLALKGLTGGGLDLRLEDADGNSLGTVGTGTNLDKVIHNVVAPATRTYFARVSNPNLAAVDYNLVVTRNADFDTHPNQSFVTAQDITGTAGALGNISITTPSILYVGPTSTSDWNNAGAFTVTQVSASQFATQSLSGFDEIWVDSSAGGLSVLQSRAADIANFVSAGGGLVSENGGNAGLADFGWAPLGSALTVVHEDSDTNQVTALGATHPITTGITDAGLSNWFTAAHDSFSATAGLDVLATNALGRAIILAGSFDSGRVVYMGIHPTGHKPAGQSIPLIRQAAAWAARPGGQADWYKETATAGQTLTLITATPADDPGGEFHNTLSPHIQLYDPAGNLVADGTKLDDGRNEQITYTALVPGAYRIKLTGDNGTVGEYFLDPVETGGDAPPAAPVPPGGGPAGGLVPAPLAVAGGGDDLVPQGQAVARGNPSAAPAPGSGTGMSGQPFAGDGDAPALAPVARALLGVPGPAAGGNGSVPAPRADDPAGSDGTAPAGAAPERLGQPPLGWVAGAWGQADDSDPAFSSQALDQFFADGFGPEAANGESIAALAGDRSW